MHFFLDIPYILTHSKSETHSLVGKNKKFIILGYEFSLVSTVYSFCLFLTWKRKDELPYFLNSPKEFVQGNIFFTATKVTVAIRS